VQFILGYYVSAFARQLFMDCFTANIKVKFALKGEEPE
jgi:hypothetical protein